MVTRSASSIGRTVAFAIAVISVGNWILPDVTAHGQTPAPTAPAAKPEQTTSPSTAPGAGAGAPAGSQSPAAPASNTSRADCERYARVLSGRQQDATLLKQPDVKALATRSADLVTCTAVRADSDEPCKVMGEDNAKDCRATRALFHEMRAYPKGRSFMLDERKFQECKQNADMAPVCEAVRKALRSGDASQCVIQTNFESLCRSLNDVDVSKCAAEAPQLKGMLEGQCRAMVNLDEAACDIPGPRREEMAKQCREDIAARKPYGRGLKELAKSGSAREKEFAKAALDDPGACKAFAQSTVDACLAASSGPAPAGSAPATGGTDTTAPEAPKGTKSPPPPTTSPTR